MRILNIIILFIVAAISLSAQTQEISGTFAGGTHTGTITLVGDVTMTNTLNATTELTLDLNGHKLYCATRPLFVGSNGKLTVIDSNPSKTNIVNGRTYNGGVIYGGVADRGGGAIIEGEMYFYGGTIAECTSIVQEYMMQMPHRTILCIRPQTAAGVASISSSAASL